nr:hypothetical protein [Pseudomonas alcaliphila]
MQNETIDHLRHTLADQLAHGARLEAELEQAVATINGLFDIVGSLVDHVNVFHAQHGIEPMAHPFENLEYQAFPEEQAQ